MVFFLLDQHSVQMDKLIQQNLLNKKNGNEWINNEVANGGVGNRHQVVVDLEQPVGFSRKEPFRVDLFSPASAQHP